MISNPGQRLQFSCSSAIGIVPRSGQQPAECEMWADSFDICRNFTFDISSQTCHTAQDSAEYGDYPGFCHQTSILLVLTVTDMEDIQYQYLLNLTGTALSPLSTEDI